MARKQKSSRNRGRSETASKKRTRNPKDEARLARDAQRKAASRHVVEFEAVMSEDDKRHIFSDADLVRQLSNQVRGMIKKRYDQMVRTKKYRGLLEQYGTLRTQLAKIDPDDEKKKDEYDHLDQQRKAIGNQMKAMQKAYHVTKSDVTADMRTVAGDSGIASVIMLSAAEDIWRSVKSILYKSGKKIHFKKRGDLPCMRGKQANKAIILHVVPNKRGCDCSNMDPGEWVKAHHLEFSYPGRKQTIDFRIKSLEKDQFLQDEADAIIKYMRNPTENDELAVCRHQKDGTLINTHRPCYCTLKPVVIRGKLRVFVQVCVEGASCRKKNRDGSDRHDFTRTGTVGCDNGTQSAALVSENGMILTNLGERNGKSTRESEAEERRLKRAMDRSRRAMNPGMFDAQGRMIPLNLLPKELKDPGGTHRRWKKSNHYRELEYQYGEMCRRNAASRKYANRELANRAREMGDVLIIEPKNAAKLQKKAKESKKVVKADGTVKNTKRKRFGKSVQNRCPGQFQALLKQKFGGDYHEVKAKFRASQYDPTNNEYEKKSLSTRTFTLSDGTFAQRDILAAFNLSCSDSDYSAPSPELCQKRMGNFRKMQEETIRQIKASGHKVCNSGI